MLADGTNGPHPASDVGDKVTLTVRRGGKDEDVTMVLEASTD